MEAKAPIYCTGLRQPERGTYNRKEAGGGFNFFSLFSQFLISNMKSPAGVAKASCFTYHLAKTVLKNLQMAGKSEKDSLK